MEKENGKKSERRKKQLKTKDKKIELKTNYHDTFGFEPLTVCRASHLGHPEA